MANSVLQNEAKNGKLPKIVLTTGFPYATFQFNKDAASEYFKEEKIVTYSKADEDGSQKSENRVISIHSVNIIPELVGCDTAVRKGENPEEGNYILISLGYGTCEGARDFESCPKIVLAGGGAHHKDLTNLFHNEFSDLLSVTVFENPEKCASMGYSIYSKLSIEISGKDKVFNSDEENSEKTSCIGIDIGNANTCVSIISK